MGNSGSVTNITNTVTNTLNENIKRTMVNVTSSMTSSAINTQTIKGTTIIASGCSVKTGPVSQDMQVNLSFSQIARGMDENTYNQQMFSAVDAAVKSDSKVKAEFASTGGNVSNTTNTYNNNINRVVQETNYNYFTSLAANMDNQQIQNGDTLIVSCNKDTPVDPACGAQVCTGARTQNMVATLIAKQLTEHMAKSIQGILQKSATGAVVDNTSTAEAVGPISAMGSFIGNLVGAGLLGIFAPLLIVLVIIVALSLGVWAYRRFTATPESQASNPQDMSMPPQDMGMPQQDMGMPPQDMGMPQQDTGMAPQDMGALPQDMGVPQQDMGEPQQEMPPPGYYSEQVSPELYKAPANA